jgi:peptidoglycan/LPS O-acetylase OafA/YrhL
VQYIPALDGLRATAVLLVIFAHYGIAFVPGAFGVQLFFWLSGYLITSQLLLAQQQHSGVVLINFYISRLLRLTPALFVCVGLTGVIFQGLLGGELSAFDWLSAVLYIKNYFDIFLKPLDADLQHDPFSHIWSLAVELHFI